MNLYPKRVALTVWLIGSIILLMKSGQLLWAAYGLSQSLIWPGIALLMGVVLGVIKTRMVFIPFCKKNLKRIDNIRSPRVWNAFSLKFWIMLGLMMTLGATLSRFAQGSIPLLSTVATIDLMVGLGLLFSSRYFFKR